MPVVVLLLVYIFFFQGIFISRVSKGGPSEKAGVHIGDRVLEVGPKHPSMFIVPVVLADLIVYM